MSSSWVGLFMQNKEPNYEYEIRDQAKRLAWSSLNGILSEQLFLINEKWSSCKTKMNIQTTYVSEPIWLFLFFKKMTFSYTLI